MAAAAIGGGAMVAGNAMNARGQDQAAESMQRVWEDQRRKQRMDDAILQGKTQELIGAAGKSLSTQPAENQIHTQLDAVTANTANAVAKNQNRRPGDAESRALITSGAAGAQQRANINAALMARLQAFGIGARELDMLGRQFALDRQGLGIRQRERAGLIPVGLQAAGLHGIGMRTGGTTLSALGQAGIQYGMSRPSGGGSTSGQGGVGVTSAPPEGTVLTPEGAVGPGYDWLGRPVWSGGAEYPNA